MSIIKVQGNASGTGSMTLESPATNSDRTITLPDVNGVAMVSGNMPAFSAYSNASQTVVSGVNTLITNNTETFDTANAFNSTGSTVGTAAPYSFNPQVAGYYLIVAAVRDNTGVSIGSQFISWIFKNGTFYVASIQGPPAAGAVGVSAITTALIYMNGSTDYVQQYVYTNNATNITTNNTNTWSYFNGALIRAA